MDWKTNHLLLAEKLVLHIDEVKTTTFDKLEVRARQHGISMAVFYKAIEKIHKLPQIKQTTKFGNIHYELQAVKPKPGPVLSSEWMRDNYPYPIKCSHCGGKLCASCFPFYNPEEDTIPKIKERLYMTRDEYKAASQGKTFIPKKKAYEYSQK